MNKKLLKRYIDKMVKDVVDTAIDEVSGCTEGHEIDLDRAKERMDKKCNILLKKIENGVLPEREKDTHAALVEIVERAYQKLGAEDGYGWIRNDSKPLVGVGSVEEQLHKAYKRQIAILRKKGIDVDTVTEQDLASIEADKVKKPKENKSVSIDTKFLKKCIDKMTDDIVDTANKYYGISIDLSAVRECMDDGCERLKKQVKKRALTKEEGKAVVKAMEEINKKAFRKIYDEDAFGHFSGEKSEAEVNDVIDRIEKTYKNYVKNAENKDANIKYKSSDLYVLPSDIKKGTIVLDSAVKTEFKKQIKEDTEENQTLEENDDMER